MKIKARAFLVNTLAFLAVTCLMTAQQKPTDFIIKAGAGANGNIYSSSFTQLPGYPNCCTNFTGGFGLGAGAWAGAEYEIEKPFAGGRWRIEIALGYTGLSAGFSEQDNNYNIITGNEVRKANIEYRISPVVNAVFIDQGFIFYPFEQMPVGIKAGFQLGFPLSSTFSQETELLNPGDRTFNNGTTKTGVYAGDLPDAAGQLFFLTVGLRYDIYKWGNFSLVPEIQYNYGLNNVVTSVDWKTAYLRAGVTVNYRIPKSAMPPPPPPPPAPLPEPPAEKPLVVKLGLSSGSHRLSDRDTVYVTERETLYVNKYHVLPVSFYKKDEQVIIDMETKPGDPAQAQGQSLMAAVSFLKSNPTVNAAITYSGLDDESQETHDDRIYKIRDLLISNGILPDRFTVDNIITATTEIKDKERTDEYRSIKFEFSDGTKTLLVNGETRRSVRREELPISIEPLVSAGAQPVVFGGSINIRGQKIYDLKNEPAVYALNESNFRSQPASETGLLSVAARVSDAEGKQSMAEIDLNLRTNVITEKVYENLVDSPDGSQTSQYILGYNDFDKSDMKVFNREVLDIVRASIAEGKTVEILPLADNLGTREHNDRLVKDRAAAALRLIGADEGKVTVVYPENYLFSNDEPGGRLLNRSVVVRIIN